MKKLLCAILTLLMIVTAALPTFAAVKQNTVGYSEKNVKPDDNFSSAIDIEDLAVEETVGYDSNLEFNTTLLKNTTYFYIDSVEGLKLLSKIIASASTLATWDTALMTSSNPYCFKGKTIYLANDITFQNGDTMAPIGEDNMHFQFSGNDRNVAMTAGGYGQQFHEIRSCVSYFSGTFDGQGYTIDNLKMTASSNYRQGNGVALFKAIRGDATIKNLVIGKNCSFVNQTSADTSLTNVNPGQGNAAASLACYAFSHNGYEDAKAVTVTNVISYATVTCGTTTNATNNRHDIAGGLIAGMHNQINSQAAITECTFAGQITDAGNSAGGIVGVVQVVAGSIKIEECLNAGAITSTSFAGGILGGHFAASATYYTYIASCINTGNVVGAEGKIGAFYGSSFSSGEKINIKTSTNKTSGLAATLYSVTSDTDNVIVDTLNGEAGTDALVRYEGLQIKTGETQTVRFVGSITASEAELANYDSVGFKITAMYGAKGRTVDANGTEVYTSINGTTADGWNVEYSADEGEYLIAIKLEGLSKSLGEVTFVVTPYCVSGETTTYGTAKTTTVNMSTGIAA